MIKNNIYTHWEVHLEGVHDLEVRIAYPLLRRQLVGSLDLLGGEGDAGHFGPSAQLLGNVAGSSANATAHVQDLGRLKRLSIQLGKCHHLVNKVVLGTNEVLFQVAPLLLLLGVVPEVNVLPQ